MALGNGASDKRKILVGISRPFKLTDAEIAGGVTSLGYGCVIQTGADFTRRTVVAGDELEALLLGLLSIDLYLEEVSGRYGLITEDGRQFSIESDGLLRGPIGTGFAQCQKKPA